MTRIDVYLEPSHTADSLRADVLHGLTSSPKELPPKWFYDERGSQLFDQITRLAEYYPTARERTILTEHALDIAKLSEADTLIELGSGTSEKTRLLLDAMRDHGVLTRFIPFDVSAETLRQAAVAITTEYPGVEVVGVVGDFERHLHTLPREGRRLIAFLGGTIGNLAPAPRERFLADIRAAMGPEDAFLLGTDLVKEVGRLEAAYDDSLGVTAEFNKNVLAVINRELDADFDLDAFQHVARYDRQNAWVEMLLRSTKDQTVHVAALDLNVSFAKDELMRTEISAKFTPQRVGSELEAAGLSLAQMWTDPDGDFALSLALPR